MENPKQNKQFFQFSVSQSFNFQYLSLSVFQYLSLSVLQFIPSFSPLSYQSLSGLDVLDCSAFIFCTFSCVFFSSF